MTLLLSCLSGEGNCFLANAANAEDNLDIGHPVQVSQHVNVASYQHSFGGDGSLVWELGKDLNDLMS